MRRLLLLLVLLLCAGPALAYTGSGTCNHSEFLTSGVLQFGDVTWPLAAEGSPGTVFCIKGYKYNGTNDLVYCETTTTTTSKWILGDKTGKCLENSYVPTKEVHFHGMTYNYIYLKMGETTTVPVVNPNVSYIITTEYEANMVHPTIRVRVALIGKAINPVLINIQQSTESVGFELPMRVVGKGSKELAVDYSQTERELCSPLRTSARPQQVIVMVVPHEPLVRNISENFTDPSVSVHMKYAQDGRIELGRTKTAKAQPNEDTWFYFDWEGVPNDTHFVVVNITSDTRRCATVTVRNSSCSLNMENINDFDHGMFLTLTTHAAIIVPRDRFPQAFYLSVLAETDDTPCGMPGNETGRSRHKSFEFNVYSHHQSAGFLFLPLLIIPICSMIFIFGNLYIKYHDKNRTSSSTEGRTSTMDSVEAPAQIETGRSGTVDTDTDEFMPMTISGFEMPHTRVDYIPMIIALMVLPVLLDILSTRMEDYRTFGKLDACQFNVECSFPVGALPDVGRAVTNFSYIFMGLTLLLLVFTHHRRTTLKDMSDMITGIQHDYDMLRAISYCIVLQGVVGFVYHVCPNESVESLSNIFFLVGVAYSCQKIYQNRHHDVRHMILHPVYVTVFCIGLHGLLRVSVHREHIAVWAVFGALHSLMVVVIPLQYILLDSMAVSLHPVLLYKNLPLFRAKLCKVSTTELVCGAGAVVVNAAMVISAAITQPSNFMVYLVPVFVVNMLLYLVYYILMKTVQHHEQVTAFHGVVLTATLAVWSIALYYLIAQTSISPGIAPALSREGAKPCVAFQMFDGHDAWHFFSAVAIFMTNFLVLVVDDCQTFVQTSHLAVF